MPGWFSLYCLCRMSIQLHSDKKIIVYKTIIYNFSWWWSPSGRSTSRRCNAVCGHRQQRPNGARERCHSGVTAVEKNDPSSSCTSLGNRSRALNPLLVGRTAIFVIVVRVPELAAEKICCLHRCCRPQLRQFDLKPARLR